MKTAIRLARLLVLLGALMLMLQPRAEAARWCPNTDPCTECEHMYNFPPEFVVSYCQCAWWDQWSHCCKAYCTVDYYDTDGNYIGPQQYEVNWNYCGCDPFA